MFKGNLKSFVCAFVALLLFGTLSVRSAFADDNDNEFDFTGIITSLPGTAGFVGDWTVAGRTVHVTSTTEIDRDGGDPAVGKAVEVEGVLQNDGSVNATDIEVKSDTTANFEFRGRVEQLPSTTGFIGDWTVSGLVVHVTSSTMMQTAEASIAVGVPVKIFGTLRTDGTLDATRVQTEKKEHTDFFEFTGAVQALPNTSDMTGDWTVGGRTVHVTPSTKIETDGQTITAGTVVEVKGTVRTDGSVDAVSIEPAETGPNAFEFHGVISSLPNTTGFVGDWVVDGRTVHVTSTTRINQEEGLVAVGAFVEVKGTPRSDGSIDATEIEVERSAGAERPVPTFELDGTVEQLPATANLVGDWVVSGRTVHVTSTTQIRPSTSAVTVGTFVEIDGTLQTDNSVNASSVEVEHAEGNGVLTPFFALFGTVEALPAAPNFVGDWVVSGRTIHVSTNAQILTNHRPLVVGSFVRVVGTLRSDGSIDATQIQVKRNDNTSRLVNFFEMFGNVESVPASGQTGDYRISGMTVHATSSTHFAPKNKTVAVGSRVKVVGNLLPDGTLNADAIVVQGNVADSDDFVTTHYEDFLSRDPDDSGLQFWTHNIEQCGSDQNCRDVMRVNTSAAFFLSIEFQQTGFFVERLYVESFGRLPRFAEFLADVKTISEGVVVGQPGWQDKLEANKQAFVNDWVQQPAFVAIYGQMTNAQFVDALLANAGIKLTDADRNALVNGLNNGTLTRAQVVRQIAESDAFVHAEFNRAFVLMQYFGYLRRDPDDAPDGNMSGFNFWLTKLNQFNGNFVNAEMVKAFIQSLEFNNRFSHK
jgi:acetyltransferase-like isoleucine patch superfamily enzyme